MDQCTKFKKIITLNDDSFDSIKDNTLRLLYCMEESNQLNNMRTEFISMRLKYSEKNPFSKDLVFEWAALQVDQLKEE